MNAERAANLCLQPSELREGRFVFRCGCTGCVRCDGLPAAPCARSQHYAAPEEEGGITVSEARFLGWRLTDEKGWLCPSCAGDDSKLRELFRKGRRS